MRNALALLVVLVAISVGYGAHTTRSATVPADDTTQTLYIQNESQFISDATIKNDIPAWRDAVNNEFAKAWHTTHFNLVFIGKDPVPQGAMSAVFVDSGPVKGALAYHTVTNGAPQIVVYAGTGKYYGYDNSVSFTHELFELAGDPNTSTTNQGWPYDYIWEVGKDGQVSRAGQAEGTVWFQEVCDPVEDSNYTRPGADGTAVAISDFITPNWFNDEVNGPYDQMHLVQQPFTILWGGYAQFWDGFQWNLVSNWRGMGRDAKGFYLGDAEEN